MACCARCFDLLHVQVAWWGVVMLALGLFKALFGVVFSAIQTDMKRLLAYSSIDNIGLMFVSMGLAILFRAFNMPSLAALSLTALLYDSQSRGIQEPALHRDGFRVACNGRTQSRASRRIDPVHAMGCVGRLARGACKRGLPPLSGFVSEWLLLALVDIERASYMPAVFLLFFLACCVLAWVLVRRLYHGRLRRAIPWRAGIRS